jgi:hypothetical protein
MNLGRTLLEYLASITGNPPSVRSVPSHRLRGLPAFLAAEYELLEWRWLDQDIVLARTKVPDDRQGPADIQARAHQMASHFKRPVAVVLPSLDAYRRNRLVKLGVPFVVPGQQLFIPPFADLTERFRREVRATKLSAAAQVTILYQLLRHPSTGALLNEYAHWLGYSAMTLTKVRDELVSLGLCQHEYGVRPRGLKFTHQDRALWDAARPHLRSPVRRVVSARFRAETRNLPRAGLTALAAASLLQDDALPTFAMRDTAWRDLHRLHAATAVQHPDEASARIELWRYNPDLLSKEGLVDRLSLYLSLSDSADERVRLAAGELLEGVRW